MGGEFTQMNEFSRFLQDMVLSHPVLKVEWLNKKSTHLDFEDLILWLSQEYYVSIGFVNWFLIVAAQTNDQRAKIILVQNIWEELGEGKIEDTHVNILTDFLFKLGFDLTKNQILAETQQYLTQMQKIISRDFFYGLGALGPANEYLLKLEYSKIANSYQKLKEEKKLPEGKFFQVNLDADEGHSKRIFELIEQTAKTENQRDSVIQGNQLALDARMKFYEGLNRISGF